MVESVPMHGYPLIYSPFTPALLVRFAPFIVAAVVWTLVLKGLALWYAARGKQKAWFIVLLIVNTLGLLELVYLIWFRPTPPSAGESAPIISSSAR